MSRDDIRRLLPEMKKSCFSDVLRPEHIILDLQADCLEQVYAELISTLVSDSKPEMRRLCLQDILDREKTASTFLGHGVALPHSISGGVKSLKAALGLKTQGCVCQQNRINIFLLCLCPEEQHRRYLHFIYRAANILLMPENRQDLLLANSTAQALEIMQIAY